jgi:hypothetical protein
MRLDFGLEAIQGHMGWDWEDVASVYPSAALHQMTPHFLISHPKLVSSWLSLSPNKLFVTCILLPFHALSISNSCNRHERNGDERMQMGAETLMLMRRRLIYKKAMRNYKCMSSVTWFWGSLMSDHGGAAGSDELLWWQWRRTRNIHLSSVRQEAWCWGVILTHTLL